MSEKKYTIERWGDEKTFATMLEAMNMMQLFSIEKRGKGFTVREECDMYFDAEITKEQLYDLGVEIINLSKA